MMHRSTVVLASLWSLMLLVPASALAQDPDYSFTTQVEQEQGFFTVEKQVEVYLDGNPGEPGLCVVNDGLHCYVYTVENLSGSLVGIDRFRLSIETPECDPHTVTFNPGTKDPSSSGVVASSAQWEFSPPLGGVLGTSTPEKSSQLILMSPCIPGALDDTVGSYAGEFAIDENGECLGPFEPVECELMLEKFCHTDPPSGGGGDVCDPNGSSNDCQGKARRLVFEYTGEDCGASNHEQESKASCTGNPNGAEPVMVKGASNITVTPAGEVIEIGDLVAVTMFDGSTLKSNTALWVKKDGSPIQDLVIHTSCSKPLNVGDQFGSLILREISSTKGGTVRSGGDGETGGDPTNVCQIPVLPPGTNCQGRPEKMTVRYVGGDCTATQNQGGSFQCSGDAGASEPVRIQFLDKDCDLVETDTGDPADVDLGETFVVDPPGKIDSNSCVQVYDSLGLLLQESTIHTSCSKPLRIGDRFGAIQIVGFDGQGQGAFVDYTYVATEKSGQPVENVTIEDDVVGTVTSGDSIPANGELTITVTQWVDGDTENTAVLTGTVFGQECLEDAATATVIAETIDIPTKKKQKRGKKKNKKRNSKKRGKKAMKKRRH